MTVPKDDTGKSKPADDDGLLVKIARAINPPSREVSDAELSDPGANTPDSPPPDKQADKPKPSNKA
jgi:hypothetical protein